MEKNRTWDYSVSVEPYLNADYFYKNEAEVGAPLSKKKRKGPLTPADSLEVLIEHTNLKYLRIYRSQKIMFLYLQSYRCYFQISYDDLLLIISKIFFRLSLPTIFRNNRYIETLVKCAFLHPEISFEGQYQPDVEYNLVAVANGVLDVTTERLLENPSPELFVVYYLDYAYDPEMPIPCFEAFIEDLSQGVEDKTRFLMAALKTVVVGQPDLQVFYFFYGLAGTGKSRLTALAHALVGDFQTHTTTLAALNSDQFEAVNLDDKKLILIGDTEIYMKDMSKLKALTGDDPLRGRTMYTNITKSVYLKGVVMMTGNSLLNIRDSSGAFNRRMRPFKMSKVPKIKKHLLSKDKKGVWVGELVPELPGILARVVSVPHEDVDKYIRNFHQVEALSEEIEETADILNPLRLFVREALQTGKGAFLGLKPRGFKEARDFASRVMLYPTYLDFQYRRGLSQPVSHNSFTTLLISACEQLGIKVEKVRKPSGTYIEGLIVKPNYYNPDIAAGGPMDPLLIDAEPPTTLSHYPTLEPVVKRNEISSTSSNSITSNLDIEPPTSVNLKNTSTPVVKGEEEVTSSYCNNSSPQENTHVAETVSRFKASPRIRSHPGAPKELDKPLNRLNPEARLKRYFTTSDPKYVDTALSSSFIDEYHEALSRHSTKQSNANKVIMGLNQAKAVEEIVSRFKLHQYLEPSADFLEGVRNQVIRGVGKLKKFGCIPKSYKQMGISPRISPIRYGDSINSTKKLVRNYGYRLAASVFKEYGFSIVDVDLRSAYTSVLLGLYPEDLQRLGLILRNTNLWDSIKEDYYKENIISYYDKPSVKVCVYASLFGGGKKAMFDSILENKTKAAGMTDKEFKLVEMYESTYQLASITTDFMLRHPIVQDFNDLSKTLLNSYNGCWLQGPTGHKYQICDNSFRNVFPCFLQSYEFALLAGGTLELIKQYPQVEVIGHYHDGNVLAVPTADLEEITKGLKEKVASLGQSMNLSFPIEIEVQEIFDPLEMD